MTDERERFRRALWRVTVETAGRYIASRELSPRELAYVLGLVERVALEL